MFLNMWFIKQEEDTYVKILCYSLQHPNFTINGLYKEFQLVEKEQTFYAAAITGGNDFLRNQL